MRKNTIAQRSLFDQAIDTLLSIFKPNKQLKGMDRIIRENPEIVKAVHADLTKEMNTTTGREGISAERVLRTAILKQLKGYPYRELRDQIHGSVPFRWFTQFYSDEIPHFTALQKSIKAIGDDTWKTINELLVHYARAKKVEKGHALRIDTAVIETNISYPNDARLLWDSIRVLTRSMEACRKIMSELTFNFAKRTRRSKKLCYAIVMAKGPQAPIRRKKLYKELLTIAHEVVTMARACLEQLTKDTHPKALEYHTSLNYYVKLTCKIINQCERRVLKGETVPVAEKIVSLFEDHTDIIKRGKSQSPTEFGHKALFATGKSGLITHYETIRGNPSDSGMVPEVLSAHCTQYGRAPLSLSGDRRFFSAANERIAHSSGVQNVCINKPGYRCKARKELERETWFKKLRRFRAGIEGIISTLMRSFGLTRCLWKGWESFRSYVGLSVVTFNLRKIAALL
jgi:IS5 family transposase